MLSGHERGREAPMEVDSPPALWSNSPVPPRTSPENTPTSPKVIFGISASSPMPTHSPAISNPERATSVKSGPKLRKFGGLFGGSPSRLRSSPLARLSGTLDDSPSSDNQSAKKRKAEKEALVERHLYLPLVIMGYLQVAFNVVVISAVLYFLLQFFLTIQRDVQIKVNDQLSNIMSEISQCSKQYIENRCSPDLRVPAMEKSCIIWEK